MVRDLQQDSNSVLFNFCIHLPYTACRGLGGRRKCVTFTYSRHFQTYQKDMFALVRML